MMKLTTSGKRVLYTRNLTGLTRCKFCKKHNIPAITLRSWESSTSLKQKAAKRFVTAINTDGVYCDPLWIMTGNGRAPYAQDVDISIISKNIGGSFDEKIIEEIDYLKKIHKNATYQLVADDMMAPFLRAGDYVAGCYTANFEILDEQLCLIETYSGQCFIRILSKVGDKKYRLNTINPISSNTLFLFKNEIKRIAKIFWIRKKIN